jgi:hypothetical protein
MCAVVKKPTLTETVRLNRIRWFGHVQKMEENRIPKRVLFMNLGTTRLRGRPWNRWRDEVRKDGRTVNGEVWQESVRNREEWKKLLRTARNRRILHIPMEWMNECTLTCMKQVFKVTNKQTKKQPNILVVPKIRQLVFVFSTWRPAFYSSLHSFIARAI